MSRIWIGCRVLQLPTGGYTRLFTKDDENAAKQAIAQAEQDLRRLFDAQLVWPLPNGQARPVGMSVAQVLSSLGIQQAGHGIEEVLVEGIIQSAPSGRIIMPS